VHADVAADDDDITRDNSLWPDIGPLVDEADARRVDVHTVTVSTVDHFGVPGHQSHPGSHGGFAKRLGDSVAVMDNGVVVHAGRMAALASKLPMNVT